jgi:hypothetical protein
VAPGVVLFAIVAPRVLDRVNGKRRSFSGGSHHNMAGVAANVVNSVGERHCLGIGGEIVIFDLAGFAPPGPAAIFEVANQLAFLPSTLMMGRSAVSNFRPRMRIKWADE